MAAIVDRPVAQDPWEMRAFEQRCACLASLGKIDELEKLAPQPCVDYQLALAYALGGRIDQAVERLKGALKQKPDYPGLKALAFQVALRQADLKLKQQDWNGISSAVALALEAGPASPEGARELLRFKSALPVAHIKTGARRQAADIWERELRTQPDNRALIHNLAILYYWWAAQEESSGGAGVDPIWNAAIAYWNLIVNSGEFWSGWKTELEQRWGLTLQDADLQPVCDSFLNERLAKLFQNHSSSYKEKNRAADAERHEEYLTALALERKSAEAWKPFAAELPVGGFLYYQRLGALADIVARIDRLPQQDLQQKRLRFYFSPDGLGSILTLIEERRLPEKALERLAGLPEKVRSGPDVQYLRVLALHESAKGFDKRGLTTDALRQVEAAWSEAQPQPAGLLWTPLKESISGLLESAAKLEANRLRNEDKLDEGIRLLHRLHALSKLPAIREHMCSLYCERGLQKVGENLWSDGRAYFQKALEADKTYVRAKQCIAHAYDKEAAASQDKEAAIKLLQKALEWESGNQGIRTNLARELNDKAVAILTPANQSNRKEMDRALGLLRAAARTIKADISEKELDAFIARGGAGPDEFNALPKGVYRTVLENLAYVARVRKQLG
jgi:hypothetical protein